MSFRFYDAIFHIVSDSVDEEKIEVFHSKQLTKYLNHKGKWLEKVKSFLFENKVTSFK